MVSASRARPIATSPTAGPPLRAIMAQPHTREETMDGEPRLRLSYPPVRYSPARRSRAFAVLFDISQLLHTGLDRETLNCLVGLTESGVNPEALAAVVLELRRESAALRAAQGAAAQQGANAPGSNAPGSSEAGGNASTSSASASRR